MAPDRLHLPDAREREMILRELDRNILVEASAGTGKTTSMVSRMTALLETGACRITTLAAVTFTRKAAGELRSRFQAALEEKARNAEAPAKDHLALALERIDSCFIGTIHSFCARLLRERPVEAGVAVNFQEIDDRQDNLFKKRAWEEYVAGLYAADDSILVNLRDIGLDIGLLKDAYLRLSDYPDVKNWPVPDGGELDFKNASARLRDFSSHISRLIPTLPLNPGNDKLIPLYRLVHRMIRQADLSKPLELMEILEEFIRTKNISIINKEWPGGPQQAKAEYEYTTTFINQTVRPMVTAWREHRYRPALRAIMGAVAFYELLRRDSGKLNYQDLLIRAAHLLRGNPNIRTYFRRRFSHILVDEFQDTDPIQAEVMFLLTAADSGETDWTKCRPVPGALFVVGDPKQSIYRFRRADMVTYTKVKEIITKGGGLTLNLSTNFRSREAMVEWINKTFSGNFPEKDTETSPSWVPLLPFHHRQDVCTGSCPVTILPIPRDLRKNEDLAGYEADLIARTIRHAIDGGSIPGDFLVITRNTGQLGTYSSKFQEYRIPHEVSGGAALNQVKELVLLHDCMWALLQPDNPVALVAVLRGQLFGISDAALYEFKRAGGAFSFNAPIPRDLDQETAHLFSDTFTRLKHYRSRLSKLPPVAAMEWIAADLGLPALACAASGGNTRAGSLAKAFEILRTSQPDYWTAASLVEHLKKLIDEEEKHDSLAVRPPENPPVRLLNLHKAKGLEASIVFLADPTGRNDFPINLHIDRSGRDACGYLAIRGPQPGRGKAQILAQPAQWGRLSGKEREFQDSEETRLLYVAATRAASSLIISQRSVNQNHNPWSFFDEHLTESPALPDPGPWKPPQACSVTVNPRDVHVALEVIGKQWQKSLRPTYDVRGAKEYALGEGAPALPPSAGRQGREWGSVIHRLLELAMASDPDDLLPPARLFLEEEGLDPALASEALSTVARVRLSDIWRRAKKSGNRLVEVPFQVLVPGNAENGFLPTILRGSVDLAFAEKGSWVIVDYKTDDRNGRSPKELARHYAPQVRYYADAWEKITGEPVGEAFLYFVHTDRLIRA